MTASKPPDKTLVGMPSDLKAVLQKLDQAAVEKAAAATSDHAAAPAFDKYRTRPGSSAAAPPPLPHRPTAHAAPAPQPAAAQAPAAAMDRTLIGMPSDMQAALQRAIAEQAAAAVPYAPPPAPAPLHPPPPTAGPGAHPQQQPSAAAAGARSQQPPPPAARVQQPPPAAGPTLRGQPVRAIGGPSTATSEPQAPVFGTRSPVPVPKPTVQAASTPPRHGLGYEGSPNYRSELPPVATSMKVLAPHAPLDWPPAALSRSSPGFVPPAPSGPSLAETRIESQPPPSAAMRAHEQALGEQPTQLAHMDTGPLPVAAELVGRSQLERSRLNLPLAPEETPKKKSKSADAPPKRWPAISLIALAMLAFAVVIVMRAPQLLPAPVAAMLMPSASESAAPVADAPMLPAAPAAAPTTDVSAASDPHLEKFTPTPTRPPAAPAMTSGASAQLEKRAIERLIANDYAAAKLLYEKLRTAEPSREEFTVMVELLSRAACGQPGQAPCAGSQP